MILRFDQLDQRWRAEENWITTTDHANDEPEPIRRRFQERDAQDHSQVYTPVIPSSDVSQASQFLWNKRRELLKTNFNVKHEKELLLWLKPVGRAKRKYDVIVNREMLSDYTSSSSIAT
jgi:hypothetical protein